MVGAEAIKAVVAGATEGKSVAELCALGDNTINELLSKVYKGKKMEKGIAFPTCISINNCCGHFSPLKEDSINLKKGDVAKMCDRKTPYCALRAFNLTNPMFHAPESARPALVQRLGRPRGRLRSAGRDDSGGWRG